MVPAKACKGQMWKDKQGAALTSFCLLLRHPGRERPLGMESNPGGI